MEINHTNIPSNMTAKDRKCQIEFNATTGLHEKVHKRMNKGRTEGPLIELSDIKTRLMSSRCDMTIKEHRL